MTADPFANRIRLHHALWAQLLRRLANDPHAALELADLDAELVRADPPMARLVTAARQSADLGRDRTDALRAIAAEATRQLADPILTEALRRPAAGGVVRTGPTS